MKVGKNKPNERPFIGIRTNKRHFEAYVGVGKIYGIMGGIEVREKYDWWTLQMGFTFICFYFTLKWRWEVFGCGKCGRLFKNGIWWNDESRTS